MEGKRGAYGFLVRKLEGKRALDRPRRRLGQYEWIFKEISFGEMDWINMAQDRDEWLAVVDTFTEFWVP
jgi:hypothetical protein